MQNYQRFLRDRHEQSLLLDERKFFLDDIAILLFSYKRTVLSLSFSDLNECVCMLVYVCTIIAHV